MNPFGVGIFALLVIGPASAGAQPPATGSETTTLPALRRSLSNLIRDESMSRAARRHGLALLTGRAEARWTEVRAALRAEGLADAQVLPFVAFSPSTAELEVLALRYLDERVAGRGFTHYGLARVAEGDRRGLAVFFARRLVELPPLPSGRAPHSLRGVLLAEATAVEGFFTLADGHVERADAERKGRNVRVMAPAAKEIVALELIVHTARGPEVAAQVSYGPTPAAPAGQITDLASLHRAIDASRMALGLHRLEASAPLAEAAASHARWVCEHRLAVHLRPDGEGPVERARRVGHRAFVLENIAIASSLEEAHQNLLDSPSHRRNLIAPEALKLGLGFAERTIAEDRVCCVVQLFGAEVALGDQSGL